MTFRILLASTTALALAACSAETDTVEAPDATDTLAEATPATDTSTPQGFVDTLAASDQYEIEAGRLAQEMGTSQAVKDFGAMMVEQHTASSDKLKAAVSQVGDSLRVAPTLTSLQQGQIEQLRTAGANFDAMYAQQQVNAHESALELLQTQAQAGTVEPLRTFAAEAATTVEAHLEQARELP